MKTKSFWIRTLLTFLIIIGVDVAFNLIVGKAVRTFPLQRILLLAGTSIIFNLLYLWGQGKGISKQD